MEINLNVNFRPEQLALYQNRKRFDVRVCHRRFGKTWQIIAELLIDALSTKLPDWRGHFAAPTFKQAKRNAWDYLKAFSNAIPNVQINEAELRVDYPNGSRIQLLGAEQFDSLRGQYSDHFATDETQLTPSAAFSTVIRPMLADRKGKYTAMGTPAGRQNLLFELLEYAQSGSDPDWRGIVIPVTDTKIVDPSELASMKRQMSESEYNQEMLCSFNAAVIGAYFTNEMERAAQENRVTNIRYDAAAPVIAAVDLGWSDLMVTTFAQPVGTEHHFINCQAYQATKIADMVHDWKQLPYPIQYVILPHDAEQHELSSGMTRRQIFESLGCETVIAPRCKDKHEGIEQVRHLLPHCWFDRDACKMLVEALHAYRSEYDPIRRVARITPVHDWSSHYFDALQSYAIGRSNPYEWGNSYDPKRASKAFDRRYFG